MKQVIVKPNKELPEGGFTSFTIKSPNDGNLSPGIVHVYLKWPLEFQWEQNISYLFTLNKDLGAMGVLLLGYEFSDNDVILHLYNLTQGYIQISKHMPVVQVNLLETIQMLQADLTMHSPGVVDTTPKKPVHVKKPRKTKR